MKDNNLTKFLVFAFGLYQVGHILSNIRGAFVFSATGQLAFPALPPPGGWSGDIYNLYIDMATMDTLNALVSLVFVWGYFARKPWRLWLGSVTITLSVYAAILFNLTAYQAGAWTGAHLWPYLLINLTYLPVVALYLQVLRWGWQELREAAG